MSVDVVGRRRRREDRGLVQYPSGPSRKGMRCDRMRVETRETRCRRQRQRKLAEALKQSSGQGRKQRRLCENARHSPWAGPATTDGIVFHATGHRPRKETPEPNHQSKSLTGERAMETAEGGNHQNHGFGDIAALLLPPGGQLQCGHFGRTAGSMLLGGRCCVSLLRLAVEG